MKKIPTIFIRNHQNHELVPEPNPECVWVFAGEGVATRKFDGSAMRLKDGVWSKRYDCRVGRTCPAGFEPADEPDLVTGHWPGWLPLSERPEDKWFREAIQGRTYLAEGTYEAIGPHFQGNPEGFSVDTVIMHGSHRLEPDPPREFAALKLWLSVNAVEGIVWHHADGRMAKIKGRDFGIKREKCYYGKD